MKHDFFGRSSGEFPGATEHLKKVVLFFRTEYSKQKFVFHFYKAIFDTSFRRSPSFSGKWNWFVWAIPGWNLSVLNFGYHFPKPWTDPDRFAHVSAKQPRFRNEIVPVLNFAYHLPTPWNNRDLPINLSLLPANHGVSMCSRYSPSPIRRVSHFTSALCSPEKQEKIVLVLKRRLNQRQWLKLRCQDQQNELQRTYSFGIFVRAVCFVTKH